MLATLESAGYRRTARDNDNPDAPRFYGKHLGAARRCAAVSA
ncbi:MAG TPA: hypothetical protein VGK30_11335 [Candidatus Binatia bacterium]